MIELPVLDISGKQVDALSIDESQLGSEVRPALLKQAYVMFHANRRQGSARTKSRGMVDGSTRKLYRQKGTGNARAGSIRTPIRKGGGVTFAKDADTGKWRQRMPRKMRRLANRNALLAKLVDGEVKCLETLDMDNPSTSDMKALLAAVGIDRTCLVALSMGQRETALSARNLDNVRTIRIDQLNAFEVLNHRYLVVDKATLESFLDGSAFNADGQEAA
jgi:large subunit ribosomal protein L4